MILIICYINYVLKIPNKVIERVYNEFYLTALLDYTMVQDRDKESEAITIMKKDGKIDKLCDYISLLLKKADNRVYINFNEKDLQLLMYSILNRYQQVKVKLEHHVDNSYMDIVLLENKYTNYNIIIELKYIKKKDYSDKLFEKTKNQALEQLNKYNLEEYTKPIKKYAVIFIKEEYYLFEI